MDPLEVARLWVAMCQAPPGVDAPFWAFYDYCRPRLAGWVDRTYGHPCDPEGIAHQAIFIARERMGTIRCEGAVASYLYVTAGRSAIRASRRCRVGEQPLTPAVQDDLEATTPGPLDELLEHERDLLVAAALEGLSEGHRTVIDLFYGKRYQHVEIARSMGLPTPGAARALLHRAMQAVRAALNLAND